MLLKYSEQLCNGILLLTIFLFVCAGYAHRANARLANDDPKKQDYAPSAIFLALFTWPFLLFGSIFLLVLRVLIYGLFLILFTIGLVAIRKPFILIWLDRIFTRIGNKLLKANTLLIKLAFGGQSR